jgi:hypothetical protein
MRNEGRGVGKMANVSLVVKDVHLLFNFADIGKQYISFSA